MTPIHAACEELLKIRDEIIEKQSEEVARLKAELAHYEAIKADECRCSHSLIAHLGHACVVGMPEPTHCSRCGCHKFDAPSLREQLNYAREALRILSGCLPDKVYVQDENWSDSEPDDTDDYVTVDFKELLAGKTLGAPREAIEP